MCPHWQWVRKSVYGVGNELAIGRSKATGCLPPGLLEAHNAGPVEDWRTRYLRNLAKERLRVELMDIAALDQVS